MDDDVAAKLKPESRRSGRPFREVVNDTRGLANRPGQPERRPFRITTRDLGALREGLSLDQVAELLEQAEGPLHR